MMLINKMSGLDRHRTETNSGGIMQRFLVNETSLTLAVNPATVM